MCSFQPASFGGFTVHAPRLSEASMTGFSQEDFELLFSLEAGNFWFRGRNALIAAAMQRYCVGARSMLEIGCGTGFVLQGISKTFPGLELFGSEVALAGLTFAKSRNPGASLFQMDASEIPYEAEFDVIGAFDVLEHIEDDERVVAEIFKALRRGGHAICSVPQHMFLWSEQDRYARHFRRYEVHQLEHQLRAAGFRIAMRSSFVTILLPMLYLSRRILKQGATGASNSELSLPKSIDRIFGWTLDFERRMIDLGMRLPAGGSQLVVAQKPA